VAEAATVKDAVRKALLFHPDVVVMDIRLLGGSGIDACEQIKERLPNAKVIMLTSYAEDEMLFDAIAAGACGYVLKQIGNEDLIRALETVARGEALLDPALTQRVFDRVREAARKEHGEAFVDLTDQEMRVLAQVAEGKTNREIADDLYLGEGTVRNYVSSILSKLDLSNRTEAAAYAVKHDLKDFL
jgi:DNA-binding NarL/FixJ family response regulator